MKRLLVATLLTTALTTTVPAAAESARPDAPPRASAAQQALERALDALDGKGEATLALTELQQSLHHLEGADRETAEAILARPDTNELNDVDQQTGAQYTNAEKQVKRVRCSNPATGKATPFCVHWIPASNKYTSPHEVTRTELQAVFNVLLRTWKVELKDLGFRRPVSDGTRGNPSGSTRTGLVDVYLADVGRNGLFGYAMPETNAQRSYGYMVLDNDFKDFGTSKTPHQFRAVTAAHEFFHLIQFSYDSYERSSDGSAWLMESTAAWMEERVYDNVDDNRNYIQYGSLVHPAQPLDTFNSAAEYGTWVFHELYAGRKPEIVRGIWYRAASVKGDNTQAAVEGALSAAGLSFYSQMRRFGGVSNAPGRFWPEGSAYPVAEATTTWVGPTYDSGVRTSTSQHLAGVNLAFRPNSQITQASSITISVAVEQLAQGAAYALVFHADGTVDRHPFALDLTTQMAKVLPFAKDDVTKVVLNMTNTTWDTDNVPIGYRVLVS